MSLARRRERDRAASRPSSRRFFSRLTTGTFSRFSDFTGIFQLVVAKWFIRSSRLFCFRKENVRLWRAESTYSDLYAKRKRRAEGGTNIVPSASSGSSGIHRRLLAIGRVYRGKRHRQWTFFENAAVYSEPPNLHRGDRPSASLPATRVINVHEKRKQKVERHRSYRDSILSLST